MSRFKGLIFDLDGVIVDTAKYHFLAWKKMADQLNIKFTKEDNERLKGVSRLRSMEIILEIGGVVLSENDIATYCEKKNNIYLNFINQLEVDEILPGVKNFLEDVREKGYKIALGSASKNAIRILELLNIVELFDEIIDGTKVSKAKPDPEVFIKGANALGVDYHECIVFEDAVAGIEAAHKAGMIGVGIGSKDDLPDADIHLQSFLELTIEELTQKIKEKV